jgi:hypothetical protein
MTLPLPLPFIFGSETSTGPHPGGTLPATLPFIFGGSQTGDTRPPPRSRPRPMPTVPAIRPLEFTRALVLAVGDSSTGPLTIYRKIRNERP